MKNADRILVTGAGGFIGSNLCKHLLRLGFRVTAITRQFNTSQEKDNQDDTLEQVKVDLECEEIPKEVLENCRVIIHCAGRAHIFDNSVEALERYRISNVLATERLARSAVGAGVKRFIFLSSIGVNGNSSTSPFIESDVVNPIEPYAVSKLEAEKVLRQLLELSAMELVIVRPPLVYGPNAPGNFGKLVHWVNKNVPMPLGSIHNKRSFVALDNLIDLIVVCINHPAAANEIFLVSDGEDLSTTELLKRVSHVLGKRSRLLPVNQKLLEFCLILIGKKDLAQRLCGSLQVDISKAKRLLNWTPPVSVDEALRNTSQYFLELQ